MIDEWMNASLREDGTLSILYIYISITQLLQSDRSIDRWSTYLCPTKPIFRHILININWKKYQGKIPRLALYVFHPFSP